ncbi:MAG: hypothetical protein IJ746_01150 [Ruminococcus sp.]|nr:hypothetical protein [Ruminococcus sp.]
MEPEKTAKKPRHSLERILLYIVLWLLAAIVLVCLIQFSVFTDESLGEVLENTFFISLPVVLLVVNTALQKGRERIIMAVIGILILAVFILCCGSYSVARHKISGYIKEYDDQYIYTDGLFFNCEYIREESGYYLVRIDKLGGKRIYAVPRDNGELPSQISEDDPLVIACKDKDDLHGKEMITVSDVKYYRGEGITILDKDETGRSGSDAFLVYLLMLLLQGAALLAFLITKIAERIGKRKNKTGKGQNTPS